MVQAEGDIRCLFVRKGLFRVPALQVEPDQQDLYLSDCWEGTVGSAVTMMRA